VTGSILSKSLDAMQRNGHLVSVNSSQSFLKAAVLVAGSFLILRAFYSAFESHWPENYFGDTNSVSAVISQTPARYIAFRFGPVLLAAAVVGTVAARMGLPRAPLVAAAVAVHTLGGTGYGLIKALRASPPDVPLAAYRILAMLACAAAAVVTIAIGSRVDPYIPDAEEVASAFWIALAVFVVAHLARSLTARQPEIALLLARAKREVPNALADQLRAAPVAHPEAALALAFAEHLNRPTWARRLERVLKPANGTYGLMQMSSSRPLSDQESVELFLERLPSYPEMVDREGYMNVRPFFLFHNPDEAFADLAEELFLLLES
jgi:hypothetical protein